MTNYVVLVEAALENGNGWVAADRVEAHSAAAAVKHVVGNLGAGGVFVAVPERMFRPVTVKVETTQRVRLS